MRAMHCSGISCSRCFAGVHLTVHDCDSGRLVCSSEGTSASGVVTTNCFHSRNIYRIYVVVHYATHERLSRFRHGACIANVPSFHYFGKYSDQVIKTNLSWCLLVPILYQRLLPKTTPSWFVAYLIEHLSKPRTCRTRRSVCVPGYLPVLHLVSGMTWRVLS
jgi:hypothetical protein